MKIDARYKVNEIMPVIGLGTWKMQGDVCENSVRDAIEMGYRHIDTAQMYENEKQVGNAIRSTGIEREELFVTTKIAKSNLTPEKIYKSFDKSLLELDMDYVDLLLIHWPIPSMDLESCLETMFKLKKENKVNHVGVSNFDRELFETALEFGDIVTNQVEFSPHKAPYNLLESVRKNNKILTAYSPLDHGEIPQNETLEKISQKYDKTASQIVLRWLIQLGNISVIPKASSEEHRLENIRIFDFELSFEDMDRIEEIAHQHEHN